MNIEYIATLESSFHHGAGTSGNTQRLRTQEVIRPDGSIAHVPFLSANSIRHGLRDALAWHLAKTLDLQPGTLTKNAVSLIWSGGAVTTTGAQTNLDLARRADEAIPMLGLMGYAAQSDITSGTLRVSDAILICEENNDRITTKNSVHKAAHYRGEEFGTRHDLDNSPAARFMELADDMVNASTQMIWSTQILKPGAELYGTLETDPAATGNHDKTLQAAFALWAPGGTAFLGAKTASGYGKARITSTTENPTDSVAWLTQHTLDHADEIMAIIKELAA